MGRANPFRRGREQTLMATRGQASGAVLVLEGALAPGGAALVRDGAVVAARGAGRAPGRQPDLFVAMRRVLDDAGVSVGALSGVVAGLGPGSFTGTRVALSIARALSVARPGLSAAGVDTARLLVAAAGVEPPVHVLIPWGRRRVLLATLDAEGAVVSARCVARDPAALRDLAGVTIRPAVLDDVATSPERTVVVDRPSHEALADLVATGAVPLVAGAGRTLAPAYWAPSDAVLPPRGARLADGLHVVELAPEDLDDVVSVERASFDDPWSPAMLGAELAPDAGRIALGVREHDTGRLVAFALAREAGGEMNILVVATHPDRRRQGIGRALVRELLDRARARQVERVDLEVRVSNLPAIALYEREGFTRVGLRPRYYRDGEDALLMSCLLARRPAAP
ncbi:MAG: ribosomal-protein-alanine N-acetyltransferase [Acidobacteria bacterium]|nr:MAG: ribosomal-protein-alanine N-acetyltransferase [Acidobacteriota bacterium]